MQSGADKLKDASSQVQEGISKLSDGAKSLSDGQSKFYKEGVNKDLKDVIDRFKALKSEEVSYDSFSSRADGMDGSVKFIYETEPIEVDEKN